MKVLLTGASGFIGSHLRTVLPSDWDVVAPTQAECDLLVPDHVARLPLDYDLGIHLAANVRLREGMANPHLEWDSLAMLTNVLKYLRFGRFIYFSSGAVYEGHRGPVHPGLPVKPTLPYAIAKCAGEQVVKHYRTRMGTVGEYLILRSFGAYGPGEPSFKLPTRLLTATEPVQIHGDGHNLVDFLYIDDLVQLVLLLVKGSPADATMDIAAHNPVSIRRIVETVREIRDLPPVTYGGEATEYNRFFSVYNTVKQYYDYAPQTDLPTGLRALAASCS
jgi:UDP-glucose 4-epimerase